MTPATTATTATVDAASNTGRSYPECEPPDARRKEPREGPFPASGIR